MILLTTSDYFPKLGGLTTFTANLEVVFKELGLEYQIFHWKKISDIETIKKSDLEKYSLIVNVHSHVGLNNNFKDKKVINFIHGSEALFTSPNFLKRLVKKIFFKKKYFYFLEQSYLNIFISEATLKKTRQAGLNIDFGRDLVLHNGVKIVNTKSIVKTLDSKIIFTCIARNVPHKNIAGAVLFCEIFSELIQKKVQLILPEGVSCSSSKIEIEHLKSSSDSDRNSAYLKSHFNLLLSLDHSAKGFYEGFGLTVLESAQFCVPSVVLATGGLPEAVHHEKTGWVLSEITQQEIKKLVNYLTKENYRKLSDTAFIHTQESHSLDSYYRLFETLAFKSEAS